MSAHTPGPWRVNGRRIEYGPMVAGDGWIVAKIIRDQSEHETDANARLIAAAPALLAFVERFEGNGWDSYAEMHDQARAAIAQARGRSDA